MPTDGFPPHLNGRISQPAADRHLRACVEELYDTALAGLARTDPACGYQAIARLSGHFAAMRRAVFPVASRQPDHGHRLVASCRAEGRKAERALRGVECLLAGQSRALRMPAGSARALLDQRLGDYRVAEDAVLSRLDGWLAPREHHRLTADYRTVLKAAPTRPHPRCPHTGPLAGLVFRMCVARDRVLDAVDSRPARPAP